MCLRLALSLICTCFLLLGAWFLAMGFYSIAMGTAEKHWQYQYNYTAAFIALGCVMSFAAHMGLFAECYLNLIIKSLVIVMIILLIIAIIVCLVLLYHKVDKMPEGTKFEKPFQFTHLFTTDLQKNGKIGARLLINIYWACLIGALVWLALACLDLILWTILVV